MAAQAPFTTQSSPFLAQKVTARGGDSCSLLLLGWAQGQEGGLSEHLDHVVWLQQPWALGECGQGRP